MFKKTLFTILTFLVVASSSLSLFATSAKAQGGTGPWYNQNPAQWYTKVYDDSNPTEIFGERYTAAQVQWIIYTILTFPLTYFLKPSLTACILEANPVSNGGSLILDLSTCGNLTTDASSTLIENSALAQVNPEQKSIVQQIFADRPLSGISYTKDLARNFHIIPRADAQAGFGYGALTPVQRFWGMSRDVTYGLMVLIIIIMAFMIMFRTKISPQTVITVQSALPKVIITLVLITFSYAIAGFVVDLVYVVLGLLSLIFSGVIGTSAATLFSLMVNGPNVTIGTGTIGTGIIGAFIIYIIAFILCALVTIIGAFGILGGIAFVGLVAGTGGIALVVGLIILIALVLLALWSGLKTVWTLVKAFSTILLLVIFAPFQIAIGAVYSGTGFGAWLKSLLGNVAVFVVVNVLLLFSFLFLIEAVNETFAGYTGAFGTSIPDALWSVTLGPGAAGVLTGNATGWPPLLAFSPALIYLATSFVLFLMIPKASELTKSVISGKPFAYGTAITGAIPGYGILSGGASAGASGGFASGLGYINANRPWVKGSGFSMGGLRTKVAEGAKGSASRAMKIDTR